VLLRGRVLGRARRSTASAEALGFLDGVHALAAKAHGLEHLSPHELAQLKELLDKLRQAPVTLRSPWSDSTLSATAAAQSAAAAAEAVPAAAAAAASASLPLPLTGDTILPLPMPLPRLPRSPTGASSGACDADASRDAADASTAPVAEMAAPQLIRGLKGRLRVSPRTVLMELPRDLAAAKAALRLLTRLRRKQQLAAANGLDDDDPLGGGPSGGGQLAGYSFGDGGWGNDGDDPGGAEEAKENGFAALMTSLITNMRVSRGALGLNGIEPRIVAASAIPEDDEEAAGGSAAHGATVDPFQVF
jgi:hypothetical protein